MIEEIKITAVLVSLIDMKTDGFDKRSISKEVQELVSEHTIVDFEPPVMTDVSPESYY